MKDLLYKYLLVLFLSCFNYGYFWADGQRQCNAGWFGSQCQYKCHCRTLCNVYGDCPDGCEPGWFGAKCQYQDLITFTKAELASNGNKILQLQDNDDTTCIEEDVEVDLKTEFYFTWLRAVVKYTQSVELITVFQSNNKQNVRCNSLRKIVIEKKYIDIQCFSESKVRYVKLIIKNLIMCSLWISGGKNVALKQHTELSTTYNSISISSNAVDGNTDSDFNKRSCTHTNLWDTTPRWMLTLQPPAFINRIFIYNRKDSESERLKKFSLIIGYGYMEWSERFPLNDTPTNIIIPKTVKKVEQIYVDGPQQIRNNRDVILTLCEVETYADCEETKWGLECGHFCENSCENGCRQDDGRCSEMCPGYKDPPFCSLECDYGSWGESCISKCSANCISPKHCHKETGHCNGGCKAGYKPPLCVEQCDYGSWGESCISKCSVNCISPKHCHKETGHCNGGCKVGYKPPLCVEQCEYGFYGTNCSVPCSSFCKEKRCNPKDGTCKHCTAGYMGSHCLEPCEYGTWGEDCRNMCSSQCKTPQNCNKESGLCIDDCSAGYRGTFCDTRCSKGTHGSKCVQNCSDTCLDNDCDAISGICFNCTSGYQGNYCEQQIQSNSDNSPVIIIIIVISTLMIMVAVLVLIWRFRKRGTSHSKLILFRKKSVSRCNAYVEDDVELDLQITEIKSEPVKNIPDITFLSVNEIHSHLTLKEREFFVQQYKSVIQPENVTTEAALGDENRAKNRYKNISPYDHSRVCLKINIDSKEGDYINASYIKNYKGEIKFIASQGPNKVMIDDFIRMLWEQRTDVIAMLTKTVENGKMKCEQYWPEKGTLHFGKIKVKLLYTETFADFSIRKLELIKKDEISHSVTQFHFHSWPDQNVPSSPWGLLEFYCKVSSFQTSKPIVVHCSAGVGRTGTFIGLCDLIDQAQKTGRVDFFDTLVRLRQDRMWMIQTAEQYIFLHKAVLVSSLYLGTYNEANEFYEKAGELGQKTSSGKTKLEEEYQNICSTSAYLESDSNYVAESESEETKNVYENSASVKTSRKNRFSNILPKSDYRVFLASEPKDSGNYINAVFVQNFRHKDQHILTQLPMLQTLVDFWRMVTEYKVSLVVSFESDTSAIDESVAEYLPSNEDQVIMCTPFKISSAYRKETDLWEERNLTVHKKSEHHKLVHLKSKFTDLDSRKLLTFIKQLRSYDASGKTVYMCRNGATYSGLISVLCNLMDRLDNDMSCSIPIAVGLIKSVRPQAISTLEQYKLLFDILLRYTENSSVYGNVSLKTQKTP